MARSGPSEAFLIRLAQPFREGYRTILIPEGQRHDPRWNIDRLSWDLNVEVKEVRTIEEAYHLMTGRTLD